MRLTTFIGRLTAQPELRHTPTGTPVLNIELLVREKKGETWEEHRFPVVVFGEAAKRIARQGKHGSEIVAFCKPECRDYTSKGGKKGRSEDHVASWIRIVLPEDAPEVAR